MTDLTDSRLLAFLRQVPIFADLDESSVSLLARVSHLKKVPKGKTIFYQDDPGDATYVVYRGRVAILLATADGRELVINEMVSGDCFGELALLLNKPRSASAVAWEASEVVWIPGEIFLQNVEAEPKLMRQLLETIANRLRNCGERESALAFLHAPARLAQHLLQRSERSRISRDLVAISQWELAQHVGVTRQTVAKILGQWRRDGWILTGRGRIMILDRMALEALAEKALS